MVFFKFELKRFLKNPKNKICLGILIVIFLGLFILNEILFARSFSNIELDIARQNLQQSTQMVSTLEQKVSVDQNNEKDTIALEQAKIEQKILEEQLLSLEKKDYERFAQLENNLNYLKLKSISDQNSSEYKSIKAKIDYYEKIESIGAEHSASINNSKSASFVASKSMMGWLASTTILVLLTVLISDSVSSEIESSQIRFYPLIGGRKLRYLFLKLLVPAMVCFLLTAGLFSLLYLFQGFRTNFGAWKYPYLLPDGTLETVGSIALKSLILYFIALLFLSSLGQFLSLIFKKSLVVIGLIVVFLTGFATFSQEEWFQPIKKFLPFEYLGYGQLVNDIDILPNNSFTIAILYLLSLSFVLFLISSYLYQNFFYRKG
ncbi:ABC transporter permease [Streptococcus merionis]|uniref:ABC-2 family transporter protein n=1 Tax=Streptococcus merionis TaxID=400065 RepID=A0A239SRY8_9STRE|nr:ABC transporter permease [Streptococcus merionis]SNU88200.1 ABC-2 family transporter protein [Streptococcus merionis]